MKRWMLLLLALMLVLSTLAMPAFAVCSEYADTDGDGICDNRTNRPCRMWIDENGRPCQGLQIRGSNFTDTDDDGVCDNQGTGCHGNGRRNRR